MDFGTGMMCPVSLQLTLVTSTCVKPLPLPLSRSYLHLDTGVPALQTPPVVGDVGVAQREALDAVQGHRFSGLDDDITTCVGDGLTWRCREVTEKRQLLIILLQ